MCFAHALLHAQDLKQKGYLVRLVIEGSATAQIRELAQEDQPFSSLFRQVREAGIIDCVCIACAKKTGALESANDQGLTLCGEMSGHPSMAKYLEQGYQVIVF
jgi:hypothetical protein